MERTQKQDEKKIQFRTKENDEKGKNISKSFFYDFSLQYFKRKALIIKREKERKKQNFQFIPQINVKDIELLFEFQITAKRNINIVMRDIFSFFFCECPFFSTLVKLKKKYKSIWKISCII